MLFRNDPDDCKTLETLEFVPNMYKTQEMSEKSCFRGSCGTGIYSS